VLRQAQGRQSLNRLGLSVATMWLACASMAAGAAAVGNTRAGPPAASPRARAARAGALDLSGPRMTTGGRRQSPLRLDAPRAASSVAAATSPGRPAYESYARASFAIRWQSSPEWVRAARNFRRNGLPLVRLWESGRGLVALGLNPASASSPSRPRGTRRRSALFHRTRTRRPVCAASRCRIGRPRP